ncbi:hypothetical protein scyTo_0024950 [Scyliorhinus torazame]|uniref:PAS domain-containing protein n=1 Tax=Scyliorhinus torazame TaxID=75743 RepID=A0A401QG38_SCYTO|nr:hypothetical protein [Scyliorhinus torazame]
MNESDLKIFSRLTNKVGEHGGVGEAGVMDDWVRNVKLLRGEHNRVRSLHELQLPGPCLVRFSSLVPDNGFSLLDCRISDYMDLSTADVVGKNCYHFIHAEDVEGIRHSHLDCKYLAFPNLSINAVRYCCFQTLQDRSIHS